jgi:hypothetical protein
MGIISRLLLDHPALGTAGGSALHGAIETMFTRIGDMIGSRFYISDNVNDGASVDWEHNFKCAISELKIILFSHDEGTGELTRIVSGGTPDLDDFTIIATPSFATTKIRVTNNTGGQVDIAGVIFQGDFAEVMKDLDDVDSGLAPLNDQVLQFETSSGKWKAKTFAGEAFSLSTKTSNFNFAVWNRIYADTTSGVIVGTLPTGALPGQKIELFDIRNKFGVNKVTVDATTNSQLINGASNDWDCDVPGKYIFEYVDATFGWFKSFIPLNM